MAVLQKVKIIANERLDLPDFQNLSNFVCNDFSQMFKHLFNSDSYVVKGFELFNDSAGLVSLVPGHTSVYVKLSGAMLLHTSKTSGPVMYVGSDTLSPPTAIVNFVDNTTNYIYLDITTEDGVSDTRAIWDTAANSGTGAEFTQIVDTVTNIAASVASSPGAFPLDPNKVPIAEIKVVAGAIVAIYDRRNMFFRLGKNQPYDHDYIYPWTNGRLESTHILTLAAGAGDYTLGETISGSVSTTVGVVTAWNSGTNKLTIKNKSLSIFSIGENIVGATSSTTRALNQVAENFTSADKNISDLKTFINAVMTEIKGLKGTNYWFENPSVSLIPFFFDVALTILTGNGRVSHDTATPGLISYPNLTLKPIASSVIYTMTAGSFTLADGEVLYVDLNEGGNRGISGARTIVKAARSAVPFSGDVYWIAFRDDNGSSEAAVYFRGTGLIQPGESQPVGEEGEKDFIIDRNVKLVRGGIWSWNLSSTSLSWSDHAYLQVPGLAESRNRIPLGSSSLLDADGKVLYVDINRNSGVAADLTVAASTIAAFVNQQNRFVIARRIGNDVVVGTHSQLLIDQQFAILEDTDHLANDARCRAVAASPIDKTIKIWPSQRDSNGKKVYTYILPSISSKFPRTGYSAGSYDGGASNNQLVTISFSDSVANVVTVTATGPTFVSQVIGTFATSAANLFTSVAILINPDDTLGLSASSNYASAAAASDDDALPAGGSTQFPICAVIHERDVGGTTQNISNSRIVERRKFGGAGGGSGSGAGLGSNLADLPYLLEWEDSFSDETLVNKTAGYTRSAYDIVQAAYRMSYESKTQASWTMSGTGTGGDPILIVGAPAFTIQTGDIISAIYNEASSTISGAPVGNTLVAAGSIFTVAMVGRRVRNTTTGNSAKIIAYTSATTVSLDRDIDGSDLTWANADSISVDSKPSVRKITTVNSQTSFVVESAFGANLNTCIMACFSQAVHSQDIATYFDSSDPEAVAGVWGVGHIKLSAVSAGAADSVNHREEFSAPAANDIVLAYGSSWNETAVSSLTDSNTFVLSDTTGMADSDRAACITPQPFYMVNYTDTALENVEPAVMYQAITGKDLAANWATEYGRKRKIGYGSLINEQMLDDLTKAGAHMFVRFFVNALESAASGTKTLYGYQAYWYRESANAESGIHQQAYGMTSNIGSTNNKHMTVSVSGGKTRIVLDWGYIVGVNPGESYGELEVMLNAQELPRYLNATITPGAYYTEVNAVTIDLDQDYSAFAFEIGVRVKYGSEDVSNQNSNKLAKLYDAIVGTTDGCTHATLAAAITACPAGGRILVNNETFIITGALATVNKDNITIEGKGRGALFDSDDTAVGITISNPGCIVRNIKLKDFTTAIDVNAENCTIVQNWFESNTLDVDTAGAASYVVDHNISE